MITIVIGTSIAWKYTSVFISSDGIGKKGVALGVAILMALFANNLFGGCFIPLQKMKEGVEQAEGDEKLWHKLVHRAEACPKCGYAVCLLSDRAVKGTRTFSCTFCGCKSHTPLYTFILPFFSLLIVAWLAQKANLSEAASIIITALAFLITSICAILIVPLKEKEDKSE